MSGLFIPIKHNLFESGRKLEGRKRNLSGIE